MSEKVPVRIRGKVYPSQTAAAKALGLTQATIRAALERGTLDVAGLGANYNRMVAIRHKERKYNSMAAMSRELNISYAPLRNAVLRARKKGKKSAKCYGHLIEWD